MIVAEATPGRSLALYPKEQAEGKIVAMMGDGTTTRPALAQADVGLGNEFRHPGCERSRQHGRPRQRSNQAARSRRGRQAVVDDRGALTTFSTPMTSPSIRHRPSALRRHVALAQDMDVMQLHSPTSQFYQRHLHAIIIRCSFRCAEGRPLSARRRRCTAATQSADLGVFGAASLFRFVGIKLIDIFMVALHLAA